MPKSGITSIYFFQKNIVLQKTFEMYYYSLAHRSLGSDGKDTVFDENLKTRG